MTMLIQFLVTLVYLHASMTVGFVAGELLLCSVKTWLVPPYREWNRWRYRRIGIEFIYLDEIEAFLAKKTMTQCAIAPFGAWSRRINSALRLQALGRFGGRGAMRKQNYDNYYR